MAGSNEFTFGSGKTDAFAVKNLFMVKRLYLSVTNSLRVVG